MRIIILVVLFHSIFSCTSKVNANFNSAEEVENTFKPFEIHAIEGYFLKNTILLQDTINYMVFSNQKDFNTYFGTAKTMKNTPTPINFNTERIAAILSEPTDFLIDFKVITSIQTEKGIHVSYSLEKGEQQSFISSPLFLFKIPKKTTIASIKFIHNHNHSTIIFPIE